MSFQITSLRWEGGHSDTAAAIRTVRQDVLSSTANRLSVEDIVIVVIGGW